ncbi:class I SAM-dependent methyltransferase [Haloechinothrix halophila]|uniref:class I SAM-dependent methyltransferase n=1 Tax=Haloechinothrix halophila TaxID=1069073 RepID=UPI000685C511|nr:class I SAM-dependent methyltransferase [Haloechinothrix halophila]
MTEPLTGGTSAEAPFIDDDALRLPSDWDAVVDVCIGGQWVWSISPPSRRAAAQGTSRRIPWPHALRPYLDGKAQVTIREHISKRVLADQDHWFGTGDGEVRIVDAAGQPLSLDKNGHLQRAFDTGSTAMVDSLLDGVETLLRDLREECGIHAFIAFGALLGAVREGELIGHDSDADLAYLSDYTHPLDVARESFHLRRVLRRHGHTISPLSAASFKTLITDADGDTRGIDVFAGFIVDDDFHLLPAVKAPLPRSAILPLGEVTLHGRQLPAPADKEALLEATYGENWRVPDPSFTFRPPRSTRQRLTGWVRGLRKQHQYWESFYSGQKSAAVPDEPSAFAQWVHERESTSRPLVEIGFGTGRDALWFAGLGYQVHGLEYAHSAVEHARDTANATDVSAEFEVFNLYELRQVLAMGARLAQDATPKTLYGRFLLHALEDDGRQHVWRLAQMALRAGGLLYLEFRTGADAKTEHAFGEHFRRFLDPDAVVNEIEARGGHIEYREENHGLAVYKDEDPHVCRLAVRWSQ